MTKKIIGIGNAITDILCKVEDKFINNLALNKGSMSLIDEVFLDHLRDVNINKICSGGSVGNSIATLAQLGNNVDFIGNVANDFAGKSFIDDLTKYGAKYIGSIEKSQNKSASSYILITPDAQRTMCTFLGCASDINIENLNEDIFFDAKILYIEGYMWDKPKTIAEIKKLMALAKKHNTQIAFSLSDTFCVNRHHQDFVKLVNEDIDIVFANEHEIMELLQIASFDIPAIVNYFNKVSSSKIIAITRSEKGCIIINNHKVYEVPTQNIDNVVDTTGAGDNFASGFLHNYLQNKDLKICAEYGNFLAGKIIQKIGARFSVEELNDKK